jgi:hypothetical protein
LSLSSGVSIFSSGFSSSGVTTKFSGFCSSIFLNKIKLIS